MTTKRDQARGRSTLIVTLLVLTAGAVPAADRAAAVPAAAAPDGASPDLRVAVDAYLQPFVQSHCFSGSVLIAHGDSILVDAGYGAACIEHEVANSPQTRFRIASLSKTFTAAAVLLLEQRGLLQLGDPLARWVGGLPNGDSIIIHHLLGHTSGLPRLVLQPDYGERSRHHHTTADLIAWISKLPPVTLPGQRAAYSNANYILLAAVIEQVSGMPYGAFLRSQILNPLGLEETGYTSDALQIVPHLATGYHPLGRSGLIRARHHDYTVMTGAGGLYSTTHDLLRWYRSLRSSDLLEAESRELLFSRRPEATTYAWRLTEIDGCNAVSAQGWDGVGFAGKLVHLEEDDLTVVVLSNLDISSLPSEVAANLIALARGNQAQPLVLATAPADRSLLKRLAGLYRFGPDFYVPDSTMRLVERDGHLLVDADQPGALLRITANEFIHRQHWVRIRFEHDQHGEVTGMSYGPFTAQREGDGG